MSILAFQQASYIREAIESVLAQVCDFELEVVIGVDGGGGDSTANIAEEYARRYPETIRAICHPHRLPGVPGRLNNITNLETCTGKYIAMLDGDDYWIDPYKLDRQVRLLENDPSLTMTFHDVAVVSSDPAGNYTIDATYFQTRQAFLKPLSKENKLSLFDVGRRGNSNIPTSSMVFLREAVLPLPPWFASVLAADLAIQLLATSKGYAHYTPALLGAYRKHDNGVSNSTGVGTGWHSADNLNRKLSELKIYQVVFGRRIGRFASQKSWALWKLAQIDFQAGDLRGATRLFVRACVLSPLTVARVLWGLTKVSYRFRSKMSLDRKPVAHLDGNPAPRSPPAALAPSQTQPESFRK